MKTLVLLWHFGVRFVLNTMAGLGMFWFIVFLMRRELPPDLSDEVDAFTRAGLLFGLSMTGFSVAWNGFERAVEAILRHFGHRRQASSETSHD